MSDIYLQITETPTVVTLSAPVVSGALAWTVTVANTVTVALDSNSLSALENVTVTVGAAVTISNFPATQAVSLASVPTHGVTLASTTVTVSSLPAISGTVTANNLSKDIFDASNSSYLTRVALHRSLGSGEWQEVGGNGGLENPLPISGTVTIGSALPAGTNRIGVVTIGGGTVTIGAGTAQIGSVTASISGTVPVSGTFWQATQPVSGTFWQATQPVSLASTTVTVSSLSALAAGTAQIGSVTASLQASSITGSLKSLTYQDISTVAYLNVAVGSLPALTSGTNQIGSVTVSNSVTIGSLPALAAGTAQIGSVTASISGTVPISISSVTVGNSVTIGSLPALAAGTAQIGSVTASISANPSGALTTRFGSVTTANTAQITTAVTNTSRKYLFAQNISIGSVTMGIGFSPTTTQGIQLSAGSGIVFDSFCPTGAVYWLGATTGAAWSILEA